MLRHLLHPRLIISVLQAASMCCQAQQTPADDLSMIRGAAIACAADSVAAIDVPALTLPTK